MLVDKTVKYVFAEFACPTEENAFVLVIRHGYVRPIKVTLSRLSSVYFNKFCQILAMKLLQKNYSTSIDLNDKTLATL